MKNLLLIIWIGCLLSACQTLQKPTAQQYKSKHFEQFGSDKNILISKFETSNLQYRIFLTALKSKNLAKWKSCMYDSTLWVSKFPEAYILPFQEHYHNNPHYNDYPVVNITKYAAEAYCEWLTEEFNKQFTRKKVIFRLPTKTEFDEILASAKVKTDSDNPEDYAGKFPFNMRFHNNFLVDKYLFTANVQAIPQNEKGVCSIIGNVSEMLQDSDKVVGGNWFSFPSEYNKEVLYENPDPRIGFRIAMEILEK